MMKKIFIASFILISSAIILQSANFKDDEFIAGMALKDFGYPGWSKKYTASTLDAVRNSAARWVSIHYFNSYTSTTTPTISSSWQSDTYTSKQAKLDEYKYVIQEAKKRGYKVCLISSLFFGEMLGGISPEAETALNNSLYSAHNSTWYNNWFLQYKERLIELANLANESGADMLALGWNITYVTGDVKSVYDTTTKWKEIINHLRTIYKGKIILPETTNGYDNNYLTGMEGFLGDLDYVSLHLTMDGLAGFSEKKYIDTVAKIKSNFEIIFSTLGLTQYYKNLGKKTIIFTTVTSSTLCFTGEWFEEMVKQPALERDFEAQKNVYQAMFEVLSSTDWVGGIFPWGYWWKDDFYKDEDGNNSYSFDKGASVRKKTAEEVIYGYYSAPQKTVLIDKTTNYQITLTDKHLLTKITIPEGTFAENVNLTISTLSISGFPIKSIKGDVKLSNVAIEITNVQKLQPQKNILVSMHYTDSSITQITDETKLVFARFNVEDNLWEEIPSTAYAEYNNVVTTITHLSKFALIQPPTPTLNINDTKVKIGEIKIIGGTESKGTVNPDKGENVKIDFRGDSVGKFECRIFTLTGELVYEETKENMSSGRFNWIPKNIASGIYIVSVKGPGINVHKKVAILR